MLAPSNPKSMNTLRAPFRIWRRFEVSSSATIRREEESPATIGLGSRERIQNRKRTMGNPWSRIEYGYILTEPFGQWYFGASDTGWSRDRRLACRVTVSW